MSNVWKTWSLVLTVAMIVDNSESFTLSTVQRHPRQATHRRLGVNPVDLSESVQSIISTINHVDSIHASQQLDSMLSTMYTATADAVLKPAHGHTQPLWGPPDPYLSAGKSIAPSANSLSDMGIMKGTQDLPQQAQIAASKGWNILDSTAIKAENILPGFRPTGGILPGHNPRIPAETSDTFAAQVEWSASFLNVFDKLPSTAFAYALVEFFLLRPGIDSYKEDIELEPGSAFAETVVTTGVRLGVFLILAVVTTGLFG